MTERREESAIRDARRSLSRRKEEEVRALTGGLCVWMRALRFVSMSFSFGAEHGSASGLLILLPLASPRFRAIFTTSLFSSRVFGYIFNAGTEPASRFLEG